jgi:hypothetical protein
MQHYISEINGYYNNKLLYILKKKKIEYLFGDDNIKIIFKNFNYNFIIYHTNFIPQFILFEQNENKLILEASEIINMHIDEFENINMHIDEFETLEDIIYEIIN